MSRPSSLSLLLRVRELHERLARTQLAGAAAAQSVAEQEVADLEEALIAQPLHEALSTSEFRAVMAAQRSMAALVISRRDEVLALAGQTAAARDAWLIADRDRESIDRLREREEQREDAERAEQRANDDLATARHTPTRPQDGLS